MGREKEGETIRASCIDFISAFSTREETEYLFETMQASGTLALQGYIHRY